MNYSSKIERVDNSHDNRGYNYSASMLCYIDYESTDDREDYYRHVTVAIKEFTRGALPVEMTDMIETYLVNRPLDSYSEDLKTYSYYGNSWQLPSPQPTFNKMNNDFRCAEYCYADALNAVGLEPDRERNFTFVPSPIVICRKLLKTFDIIIINGIKSGWRNIEVISNKKVAPGVKHRVCILKAHYFDSWTIGHIEFDRVANIELTVHLCINDVIPVYLKYPVG